MARNPLPVLFPCHRVVDAAGDLHHYGYGLEMKAKLLRLEGYALAAKRHSKRHRSQGTPKRSQP